MKFGIHNSSWLDRPDPAEAFEAAKAKAQWAEDHGFAWFSVMDHTIQIPRVGAPDEPVLEGWTVLAGLAAVTGRIRLATLATAVGYRNPAHLAKIAASVDLISQGRLTLGIGAGFFEDEYRQYGWEFPSHPATRPRQMEEAVQLILKMWTEPRTTFHGQIFTSRMRSSSQRHYRATLGGTWYRYSFRYSISAPRSSMATRMRSRIDSMDRRRSPLTTGRWRMLA